VWPDCWPSIRHTHVMRQVLKLEAATILCGDHGTTASNTSNLYLALQLVSGTNDPWVASAEPAVQLHPVCQWSWRGGGGGGLRMLGQGAVHSAGVAACPWLYLLVAVAQGFRGPGGGVCVPQWGRGQCISRCGCMFMAGSTCFVSMLLRVPAGSTCHKCVMMTINNVPCRRSEAYDTGRLQPQQGT
jgi:hypothetical protein